jgi:AraC-like DNA-binding protein
MASSIFETILLLGSIQGVIVACLLFFGANRSLSRRLLGGFILLVAMSCINLYCFYADWVQSTPLLRLLLSDLIPLSIAMPLGPLLYFYVRSRLDPDFRLRKKHRAHFYPVIIDLAPYLMPYIFIMCVLLRWSTPDPYPWGIVIDTYNIYADIPRWLSLAIYLWLSARYIKAAGPSPNVQWLRQFIRVITVFMVIWLMYLIPYVIPRYNQPVLEKVDWFPVYIPLVVMIYWLGVKGYLVAHNDAFAPFKKKAAPLAAGAAEQAVLLLQKAMETDGLYLNPGLNLGMLAEHTGLTQKTISAVLNQHLHKSFYEFVNAYRVEAFKEKVREPQLAHLTLAGIALECGFSSQATFQRIFKQFTGMAPSAFRDNSSQIRQ